MEYLHNTISTPHPHHPILPSSHPPINSQAIETNLYNALPVVLITLIVGSLLATPAPPSWTAKFGSPLTDLQVFRHLFEAGTRACRPASIRW